MKRTRAYLVNMSTKEPVQIDEEEYEKVMQAVERGSMVEVKQGLINPKFIVNIVPDVKRINEWKHECSYSFGNERALTEGIIPLKKINGGNNNLQLKEADNLLE